MSKTNRTNYCEKCKIQIADDTQRCPLCQHVLICAGDRPEPTYPDVRVAVRKFRFLENLLLFVSVLGLAVAVFINISVDPEFLWSLIAGLLLFYVNVVVRFAVIGRSGYLFKTLGLVVFGFATMLGIDYVIGYQGWSLNFGLPIVILVLDLGVLVLVIINRRNWQSYMMMEIFLVILSIIPVILYVFELVKYYYLAISPLFVSAALFLGTLILGDVRARNELKRRFYA